MELQKLWAQVLGVVLLLVGILGFVMPSPLLGLFGVNTLHSIVHLVTGAIFVYAGFMKGANAKLFNQIFGVVYTLVAIVGFIDLGGVNALLNMNMADHFLHLAIGVVTLLIGFMAE